MVFIPCVGRTSINIIDPLCSGSTTDSDSVGRGSTPCGSSNLIEYGVVKSTSTSDLCTAKVIRSSDEV